MLGKLYFALRSSGDPMLVLPGARRAVHAVDSTLPLIDMKTQTAQMDEALMLTCAGAAAGFIPSRRASRVDPMHALRHEGV
jgi:hypothetical protein